MSKQLCRYCRATTSGGRVPACCDTCNQVTALGKDALLNKGLNPDYYFMHGLKLLSARPAVPEFIHPSFEFWFRQALPPRSAPMFHPVLGPVDTTNERAEALIAKMAWDAARATRSK